jgi:hypothetical protein
MTQLLAYHGSQATKDKYLLRVQMHPAADKMVRKLEVLRKVAESLTGMGTGGMATYQALAA